MEQIFQAKSVEEAIELAAKEVGMKKEEVKYEVLEEVKNGLFGKIKSEAKIKAEYDEPRYLAAKKYIEEILNKMGISATLSVTENEDGAVINIEGTETGAVIGRRGDTLDALQYLASTICNKNTKDYYRITVDSCGYREKRAETLSELAKKIAASVKKNGRTAALEPMNPYERRIIHSVITEIEGVSSKSVGEEPYRKVVISSDNPRPYRNDKGDRKGGFKRGGRRNGQPARDLDLKTSFEKDYKKPTPKPKPEDEMDSTTLYGKIIID